MRQALITLALMLALAALTLLVYARPWAKKQNSPQPLLPISAPTEPAKKLAPVTSVTYGEVFETPPYDKPALVCVAAIQMASELGRITSNRDRMTVLANQAASLGVQMVVFPECALQGYMDVHGNRTWTTEKDASGELDVSVVATTVPGSLTRHFADVARARKIYIALPLIEVADGVYYNALILLDPKGEIVAHHRKNSLWPPGDASWVTSAPAKASVVDTPFGRVGLMICHDLHTMPGVLKKARADIVLYAVGWYGPNVENWYRDIFPRRYVQPNGFAVVAANWAVPPGEKDWGGAGYSCVIDSNGGVIAMAKTPTDEEIVISELWVNKETSTGKVEMPDDE